MTTDFSTLHGKKRLVSVQKWNPGSDTDGPPDEVVSTAGWFDPETDAEITDPGAIAELERRLAERGGI